MQRHADKPLRATHGERSRLTRLAIGLGSLAAKHCLIVHPTTLRRWIRQDGEGPEFQRKRTGRPPTHALIVAMIVRMARENRGWGVPRIYCEMKKLGVLIGRSTIRDWLRRHHMEPAPDCRKPGWRDFIEGTLETLWAADFMEIRTLTLQGLVTWHALVFIHIKSRRLWIAEATQHPTELWVDEQGKRFHETLERSGERAGWLILDQDAKFTRWFKDGLKARCTQVKHCSYRSPKMNSYCERMIQTVRHECTDHFAIFGHKHLMFLIKCYERYYNAVRPHRGIGGVPINPKHRGPAALSRDPPSNVIRVKFLSGLHSHYVREDRKAA